MDLHILRGIIIIIIIIITIVLLYFQKVDDKPEGVEHNKNSIDRLDTAATHHSPAHLPAFGIRNGPDSFSALHGYHPWNSRGKSKVVCGATEY